MIRFLLFPLSLIYQWITTVRNFLYDKGWLKIYKVNTPVLCVGNITTGGTGKTPWVQHICRYLESKDKKVAIVSRGYGGSYEGILKVEADMDARLCGDEPLWLKRNTKASVYLSKKRFLAAQKAVQEEKPDVILLDDGFQHRSFHRDGDLLILDASAPFKHYSMLPMGRLREKFLNIKRAQIIIINKCNYASEYALQRLTEKCRSENMENVTWKANFEFDEWESLFKNYRQEFKNDKISICCGLGNPQAFVKTVEMQSISPVEKFIFPDHFYWKPIDVEKMTYAMKNVGSYDLMVTEKDAVKLSRYQKHFIEMGVQLWVCKMKIDLMDKSQSLFEKIDQLLGLK